MRSCLIVGGHAETFSDEPGAKGLDQLSILSIFSAQPTQDPTSRLDALQCCSRRQAVGLEGGRRTLTKQVGDKYKDCEIRTGGRSSLVCPFPLERSAVGHPKGFLGFAHLGWRAASAPLFALCCLPAPQATESLSKRRLPISSLTMLYVILLQSTCLHTPIQILWPLLK